MASKAFSIALKGASKVAKSIKKRNDIAAFRTVNILEKRSLRVVGKAVRDIYPVKNKDIKKALKVKRARLGAPIARWIIESARFALIRAKQARIGISFTGLHHVRFKLNEKIDGGSRPFIIPGRYSGKLIPVYRKAGVRRDPVTTMKGYSVTKLFGQVNAIKHVQRVFKKMFAREFGKQLDRAKF